MYKRRITVVILFAFCVALAGCNGHRKAAQCAIIETRKADGVTYYQESASSIATGLQATANSLSSTSRPNGLFENIQKWIEQQKDKTLSQAHTNALLRLKKQVSTAEATSNTIVMLINNNLALATVQQAETLLPALRGNQAALSKAIDSMQPDVDYLYTAIGGDTTVVFDHIVSYRIDTMRDLAKLNGEINIAIRSLTEYITQDKAYTKQKCQ